MAFSLGPGKFYGASLPRPRIYTNVKFSADRVDPPGPVTDPLISWANEAHWSMGGLSFKRLRLQGEIEGNVNKLRAEREKLSNIQNRSPVAGGRSYLSGFKSENVTGSKRAASVSPPLAPVVSKRRRFMAVIDEDEEEDEGGAEEEETAIGIRRVRRRLVKKLGGDFDRVASENEKSDVSDTGNEGKNLRLKKSYDGDAVMKVVEEVNKSNSIGKKAKTGKNSKSQDDSSPVSANGIRTSPRLAKRRSS